MFFSTALSLYYISIDKILISFVFVLIIFFCGLVSVNLDNKEKYELMKIAETGKLKEN